MLRLKKGLITAGLVAMTPLLSSCMHTYVGGTSYLPEGTNWETHDRRISVYVNGAAGHAYVDKTEKRVFVSLRDREGRPLLQREYTVEAGDLEWASRATGEDTFDLVFYEFDAVDPEVAGVPNLRQILGLVYKGEDMEECGGEMPAPDWVTSRVADQLAREDKRQVVELTLSLTKEAPDAVLDRIRAIAATYDLTENKPGPEHFHGLETRYSTRDFSLAIYRDQSPNELQLTLNDWGRHEYSSQVQAALADLGAVQVSRSRSVYVRESAVPRETVLRAVEEEARIHGYTRSDSFPPACLVRYESPGIQVSVSELSTPDRVVVFVEDSNPSSATCAFEDSLRTRIESLRSEAVGGDVGPK
ncbi:MAG: hypothetical protein JNK74_00890 [Candidatus Hydrogenedentes bacterium]|nr:hypothetical protein [Candidatus Hydrogenedentota bacterium]